MNEQRNPLTAKEAFDLLHRPCAVLGHPGGPGGILGEVQL